MCGSKSSNSEPVVTDHYWPAPEDGGPTTDAEREALAVERGTEVEKQRMNAQNNEQNASFGSELGKSYGMPGYSDPNGR